MDHHIQHFINRLSLLLAAISTVSLLHLFFTHTSTHCNLGPTHPHILHTHTHTHTLTHSPFPSSSCDPSLPSRDHLPPHKRFKKLVASSHFKNRAASFSSLFQTLRSLNLLSNSSAVLCVPFGASQEAFALTSFGVADVTAVDFVDFPPLVKRSNLINLPFFDNVFDLVFSAGGFEVALFSRKFVEEMERAVKEGGEVAVVLEEGDDEEVVKGLFRQSRVVEVRDVSLDGGRRRMVVMRKDGRKNSSSPSRKL